jgi:hypothetical protein
VWGKECPRRFIDSYRGKDWAIIGARIGIENAKFCMWKDLGYKKFSDSLPGNSGQRGIGPSGKGLKFARREIELVHPPAPRGFLRTQSGNESLDVKDEPSFLHFSRLGTRFFTGFRCRPTRYIFCPLEVKILES